MNLNLFIARKLFRASGSTGRVSRPAILIATAGVAVGLAVMIVSVCVVMGFKKEITAKVTGMGSHVQLLNYASVAVNSPRPVSIPDSLAESVGRMAGVAHVQRFCNKEGILKTDDDFKGILLHGVGPDFDPAFLQAHLEEGALPAFSDSVATNQIVISRQMADELHLTVGSRVFAYFFEKSVRTRRFTVSGIYCTHFSDFDDALAFTDLYTCKRLNAWQPDQYSGLEIAVDDFAQADDVAIRLGSKVNALTDPYGEQYIVMSVEDLFDQVFAWLSLLDINVWVILGLMVAVAGFTMISGLLIVILERTNFIGVMKALGASNRSIRHIFLCFSVFVLARGLLWGNVVGLGLVWLQAQTGIFRLDASTYYVDSVPVLLDAGYIVAINVATLAICVLALVVPSFLVSRIHPARSIRFE